MKSIKLNNIIFPFWLLLFFPPVIFYALIGNFVIDSIVVIACCYGFKLVDSNNVLYYWKKCILKVWIFGFLADFVGALFLFLTQSIGDLMGLPYNIQNAIAFNPFSNIFGFIFVLIGLSISSILIYLFNKRFVLNNIIEDKKIRVRFAITLAIVTAPWTFFIPTQLFY